MRWLFVALVLALTSVAASAATQELRITSFENPDDVHIFDVAQGITVERSTEHVTDGKYSLKITVSSKAPGRWPDLLLKYPKCPTKDFSAYDYLAMDVYRDEEPDPNKSANFATITYLDSHGSERPGWMPIPATPRKQETRLLPVYLGIGQRSNKSKFSFADVAVIKITIDRPAKDFCVYIDNLRLVPPEPAMPDLPAYTVPEKSTAKAGDFVPFKDRQLDFRVKTSTMDKGSEVDIDKLRGLPGNGFPTNTRFSMEVLPLNLVTNAWEMKPYTWLNYENDLRKLHDTKTPFIVDAFNFWAAQEKYETLVARLTRIVKLASDLGGEYFSGLRLSESEAAAGYPIVQEQPTESAKVDAFAGFIRKLTNDIALPKDRLLVMDVSNGLPYEWAYEAGADIVGQAFLPIVPVELCISALRGMSKTYNKPWQWDVTRWTLGATGDGTVDLPFDPRTGRPTDRLNKVDSRFFWINYGSRTDQAQDMYKIYLSAYYNGARYFNGFSENTDGAPGEAIRNLYQLAEACPRGETAVSSIAVMRGKGTRWVIPIMGSAGYPAENTDSREFMYLNTFFPGFSADGSNTRCWWTGTPFGAVDTISPRMNRGDLGKYNAILFFGFNRMDGTRPDFLIDLIDYVRSGGIVVLSAGQLANASGGFDKRLNSFLGVSSVDSAPAKVTAKYFETMSSPQLGLGKKRYDMAAVEIELCRVTPKAARVLAADDHANPLLICNDLGKGHVLLFTTPNLGALPPKGKNPLVQDVISSIGRCKPLAIDIRPNRDGVQFCVSRTGNREATVFLMNHNKDKWSGQIAINLASAGLSGGTWRVSKAVVGTGYATTSITLAIAGNGDDLVISGVELPGDSGDFCSYREASFAYVRLVAL